MVKVKKWSVYGGYPLKHGDWLGNCCGARINKNRQRKNLYHSGYGIRVIVGEHKPTLEGDVPVENTTITNLNTKNGPLTIVITEGVEKK